MNVGEGCSLLQNCQQRTENQITGRMIDFANQSQGVFITENTLSATTVKRLPMTNPIITESTSIAPPEIR
jgi:hypothetical protein